MPSDVGVVAYMRLFVINAIDQKDITNFISYAIAKRHAVHTELTNFIGHK